ncbi:MAG: Rieske (2Fe-2S) protein [Deltaproteobacteria bacterium]|nr:Rieske (2Fe-2S) protein [Candidatus Zymogenaceae bacterium]
MTDGISRRGFLGAVLTIAAVLGIGRSARVYGAGSGEKWIPAGKSSDYTPGQAKLFKDEKLYVIRKETGFEAMSAKCTHFGCVVDRQADGTYLCPCHKSTFDARGLNTHGPAKKPLVWYQTKEEGGSVFVNIKGIVEPK